MLRRLIFTIFYGTMKVVLKIKIHKRMHNYVKSLLVISGILFIPSVTHAAFGDTSTYFSRQYNAENSGLPPLKSYLDMSRSFAKSTKSDIFIADTQNNVIRYWKIRPDKVATFAGNGQYGTTDGARLLANFHNPMGITIANNNDMYIVDTGNSTIRRIRAATDKDGDGYGDMVETIVEKNAGLRRPQGLTIRDNVLFITDTGNNRVVQTSLNGGVLKVVADRMPTPSKIDWYGNRLFVMLEGNQSIEEFHLNGVRTTHNRLVGGFQDLGAMRVDGRFLYVAAGRQGVWNEIWKIDLLGPRNKKRLLERRRETEMLNDASDMLFRKNKGKKELLMLFKGGSSIFRFDAKDGANEKIVVGKQRYMHEMGSKSNTLIGRPIDLILSPDKTRLLMTANDRILEFNLLTEKSRFIAGSPMDNYEEGTGAEVRMSDPTQIVMKSDGKTLYFVDRNNHRIRSINTSTGATKYLTGAGEINAFRSNNGYQEGGPCPTTFKPKAKGCAYFNRPTGIALSKDQKTLYIADGSNNRIRMVTIATGKTKLIAGSGVAGFKDGMGASAKFNGPYTLALSSDGKFLFTADKYNHAIRKIDLSNNNVTTLVGKGKAGYRDGNLVDAYLNIPEYLHMGSDGKLYFTEAGNFRIRVIDFTAGKTYLVSGIGDRGVADGNISVATWGQPKGIVLKGTTLFVADYLNDKVRKIDVGQ
ncbi:MAG: hypothetical protein A3B74_05285 [Candidatus Kerfeldbacteria bacterium RIFCSPHIGHO2_02_FULL_42_14]|uniref:SMP-30/Gluconolactonase/LRE-like region domain-containing protein n=1 Tax=Candidatus Kerfeldbacteria bacterium RIFCSPHIGHO2_02_FULL_42_14 TaxID=1798540 RepID=A0A1G2AVQ9_9BACT|nr:MAG: hypothetical protein A3B74_05285 [Candidatus Kerfeldbacteria bacterium RIFCSPHIGHO2_02_FULL_42_14]OGY81592.1 MAG: hypothetical protein A3E60_01960 [Candidatus Kerfeldbacteria bacterium RIFCSPHIGHO2_12_FULL_42_13]OGY83195.1 MAG: hypothetical protein A3I91_03370 [Candidatus Kerfeldbacteria bacterium RIFCSPLOWO2_02_FULL_42_19]OGY86252.1 MAG: hypothetical protein A3G01_00250 [Candidatus Kerfeldbacteria bacterium RIFCSPLOWO2_12_FULL_43_9]